jgi:hypothetical protein
MTKATVDERVAQYVQLRDGIAVIKERHEAELKPLVDLQNMLSAWLQNFMENAKAQSVKTSSGTAILSTRYSASLADADAFMKYVIENKAFDLIDRRANSTACRDFAEKNLQPPPGVNLSAIRTVGVRRPTAKPE